MGWFVNLKILYKILSLVVFLLCITAFISFVGYRGIDNINDRSDEQQAKGNEVDLGHQLYEQAMEMNTTTDDVASDPSAAVIAENDVINQSAQKLFNESLPLLFKSADSEEEALLKDIQAAYDVYLPALNKVFAVAKTVNAGNSEDVQRLNLVMQQSEVPSTALKESLQKYVQHSAAAAQAATDAATVTFNSSTRMLLIGTALAMLLGILAGAFMAVVGISRPLQASAGALKDLINDKLDIEIKGADRKDEVGDIAGAAQTFKEVLIKNKAMVEAERIEVEKKLARQMKIAELISVFDGTATETVSIVASASTQLSQTAESMSTVANKTNQQSIEVASASEQASHNVQSVASAAEEMAATVQEISRQISRSNDIVREAMQKAEAADNSSRELVDMSKSVGAIATLIENITGQINLLALNATIESARSGEAGKGFAVVANEVKNLATQTAKATEQIRQQLEAVQKTAVDVADMLGGVRVSIGDVSESSAAIAAAVEEQSAATHEIVSNMNTATRGVEQINSGIFAIKGGTDSTTVATREVLDAAKMLSVQAEKMDMEVKTFLTSIQAA